MKIFSCFLLIFALFGEESSQNSFTPWLTGPLIAPEGTVIPFGNFLVEPYVYFTTNTGTYNEDWQPISSPHNFFSFNNEYNLFFGLTPWMDINIAPQFFINSTQGITSTRFGDLLVALDFQCYPANTTYWFPGIKLSIRETFPTGSFQHLNPANFNTDQTGAGTFGTALALIFYKVYHFVDHYFMSLTMSASYQWNSPVRVHSYNVYGGGIGTDGRVFPGNGFQGIVSFEFTLNQNWVLALDNVYTHVNATQFHGISGVKADGTTATVGSRSSEQFSIAPAIEYNFSENLGIIAGCWFTLAGRSSTKFTSGVAELVYTY